MAGKRMTSTEIWLRLINIGSLCGDAMLEAASWLLKQSTIDGAAIREAGLSVTQAKRFFALGEHELECSLVWLEQPRNHLLTANHPLYPPLLRTFPDYPGALFVKGNLTALSAVQLAVVGSRTPSGMASAGGRSCVSSFHNPVSPLPAGWHAELTA